MRKIGINYQDLQGFEIEDYIAKAAEVGFDSMFTGLRNMDEIERIANALAKNGMEYETIHAPFKNINEIWYAGEVGQEVCDRFFACVDACVEVSAGIMIVHLSSGMTPPTITEVGQERFKKIVEYASKKNVKVAFENQRKLANLAWAMETFADTDTVGFCWDCGHEHCFTPGREYMPLFGDRLICTHIHDNEGIFNKDSHLLPFDGTMDYTRFAELVRRFGYQGPLTLEVMVKNSNHYDHMSNEAYLEHAADAARKLVRVVDGEE
jgi:sugar phosphate isomerase/epimerase